MENGKSFPFALGSWRLALSALLVPRWLESTLHRKIFLQPANAGEKGSNGINGNRKVAASGAG